MYNVSIEAKDIKMVDVDSLIPNPKNNNRHPIEQLKRLEKIIKYQGFRVPIEVSNRSGFIVCGHARLEVAKNLGMKQVPVIYQDFENEAQEYLHLTAENEIARWAELDKQAVYDELDKIDVPDIELLGLEDFELPEIEELEPQTDEDEVPEVDDPITKRGDIWLLGRHRLMCGDSTMIDDVEKLMNGEKADAVYTDPPYGMSLANNAGEINGKIKGDNEDWKRDLVEFFQDYFFDIKEVFIWGADYFTDCIRNIKDGSWVVWDKKSNENEIGKSDGMIGSSFELCFSKQKHQRLIVRVMKNTIENSKLNPMTKHPTQKPVELHEWFFEKWLEDSKNIVDLFLGSGSTLIACEKTGRACYGMELDEKYCDVIINRWQNYTGKQAVLESTGETYNSLKDKNEQLREA